MYFKSIILFILIFAADRTFAQTKDPSGEWYISYNDHYRQKRGTSCVVDIEKDGTGFLITPTDSTYAAYLPDEGSYMEGKSGDLSNGKGIVLKWKGQKLIYTKNGGMVELRRLQEALDAQAGFRKGAQLIEQSDSFPESKLILLAQSILIMEKFLKQDDKCVECCFNLCVAWYRVDNIDSSVYYFKKTMKIDSEFAHITDMRTVYAGYYNRLGWEKYGKIGKYKEAVATFKKGLAICPTNADLWYNTGGAYYSNKQYLPAMTAFKKCLEIDPENEKAQEGVDAAKSQLGIETSK